MGRPEYVSVEEVKKACKKLNIRDWTRLEKPEMLPEEVEVVLAEVNVQNMDIGLEDFRMGLEVELEHGMRYEDANVTNNHPVLTGKIVLAHLKESLDYYQRLEVAELEGDLLKASAHGDADKVTRLYKKLIGARLSLSHKESEGLK